MSNDEVWLEFLNPKILRPRLMALAIYIAAFEVLKESIVDRIQSFFSYGSTLDEVEYRKEVLSRNRSVLYASLDWYKEMKALDDADLKAFEGLKSRRNEIAHSLAHVATRGFPEGLELAIGDVLALLRKIDTWWIVNVDIPSNPDHDGKEISEDVIVPGSILAFKMMIDIAFASDAVAGQYLVDFKKLLDDERNKTA